MKRGNGNVGLKQSNKGKAPDAAEVRVFLRSYGHDISIEEAEEISSFFTMLSQIMVAQHLRKKTK